MSKKPNRYNISIYLYKYIRYIYQAKLMGFVWFCSRFWALPCGRASSWWSTYLSSSWQLHWLLVACFSSSKKIWRKKPSRRCQGLGTGSFAGSSPWPRSLDLMDNGEDVRGGVGLALLMAVLDRNKVPQLTVAFLTVYPFHLHYTSFHHLSLFMTLIYVVRWFQRISYFYPNPWGNDPIWPSTFVQMGYLNLRPFPAWPRTLPMELERWKHSQVLQYWPPHWRWKVSCG